MDAEAAVQGALDPSTVNTTRGECPDGTFQSQGDGNTLSLDPGHAYVDVDNDARFDESVDIALADEAVLDGAYEVADPAHGLVIPPSLGSVQADEIEYASGDEGHLVVAVDLDADGEIHLAGGTELDIGEVQATTEHRAHLEAGERVNATGADLVANHTLHLTAQEEIRVADADLTSLDHRVRVLSNGSVVGSGATVTALEPVQLVANGDLVAEGATLTSENAKVDIEVEGSVTLG
jgi:hypothetical protein